MHHTVLCFYTLAVCNDAVHRPPRKFLQRSDAKPTSHKDTQHRASRNLKATRQTCKGSVIGKLMPPPNISTSWLPALPGYDNMPNQTRVITEPKPETSTAHQKSARTQYPEAYKKPLGLSRRLCNPAAPKKHPGSENLNTPFPKIGPRQGLGIDLKEGAHPRQRCKEMQEASSERCMPSRRLGRIVEFGSWGIRKSAAV